MIIGFCEEEGRCAVIASGQVLSWHDSEDGALSELHAGGAPVTPEEKLLRAIFGEKGYAPRAEERAEQLARLARRYARRKGGPQRAMIGGAPFFMAQEKRETQMASKRMFFTELEIGQEFMSVSGAFIKTGKYTAKRTEAHWANSNKTWRLAYNSQVYVFRHAG